MEEYEKLLDEAYKKIKPVESKVDRFEIPPVEGLIEGNKTIVSNFIQICSYIRRNPEHLIKFLSKELAAPGKMDNGRLILVKKIPARRIDEVVKAYVDKYVTCKECGKPDTELIKKDNFTFIHCLACGAKYSIAKI
ncbi:translation initiation factor IF-2 subunit beta [Candidatus Pacearchaeota archaeon]|nr:translation initiation factor IF-2 subunit beta [Candidatus Pacearchaeota archaeon]